MVQLCVAALEQMPTIAPDRLKILRWLTVGAALLVAVLGLLNLRSIGAMPQQSPSLWIKQLLWLAVGLGSGAAAARWGPRSTRQGPLPWVLAPYGLALAAALAVAIGLGVTIHGARQWLALPGVRLHVGTLLQFGLIAALAWCVGRVVHLEGGRRWWIGLGLPLGLVLVPLGLLYRQPDMVSMLIVLVVAIATLALERRTRVAAIVLGGLGTIGPLLLFVFVFGAYQRQRLAADEQRIKAVAEAQKALLVAQKLEDMIGAAHPEQGRSEDFTMRQALDEFAESLGDQLQSIPRVEARLRRTIGRLYLTLREVKKAGSHLKRALDLRRQVLREDDPRTSGH